MDKLLYTVSMRLGLSSSNAYGRMRLCSQSVVCILVLMLFSCARNQELSFFDYPVREVEDTLVSTPLIPEFFFGPMTDPILDFAVADSLIVFKTDGVDSSILLYNKDTRQLLGRLLKKGRGPNEFLYLLDSFDTDGVYLDLYDLYKGSIVRIDIRQSLSAGYSVVSETISLTGAKQAPFTHFHYLDNGGVIVFDSANSLLQQNLTGIPDFVLFNNGQREREFHCFRNVPLITKKNWAFSAKSILSLSECLNPQKDLLCFSLWRIPQINILNLADGEIIGFHLSGKKPFTFQRSDYHFSSVCADADYIYALYFGAEAEKCYAGEAQELLYVFDWDGKLISKSLLDGVYSRCRFFNGRVYLSREDGGNTSIYFVNANLVHDKI